MKDPVGARCRSLKITLGLFPKALNPRILARAALFVCNAMQRTDGKGNKIMRNTMLAILAALAGGTALIAGSAPAAADDYPWCVTGGQLGAGGGDCNYQTLARCQASACRALERVLYLKTSDSCFARQRAAQEPRVPQARVGGSDGRYLETGRRVLGVCRRFKRPATLSTGQALSTRSPSSCASTSASVTRSRRPRVRVKMAR